MKAQVLKGVRYVVTAAIVVGLVLFARTVNWRDTWQAIRHSNMWLLAIAALVNLLSLAVKGVRWWIFLRPIGASSLAMCPPLVIGNEDLGQIVAALRASIPT